MHLVTGGAGFIGSNLVAALAARGEEVLVVDRLRDGQKWRNIAKHRIAGILPPDALPAFLTHAPKLTAVVNMGAISATTATDGDLVAASNITVPLLLWEHCAREGVPFLYASSAATYGDGAQGFADDDSAAALAALRPLNLYGWSKLAFDRCVADLLARGRAAPPQWAGLRFFNVYGPNEYHKGRMASVIFHTVRQIKATGGMKLFRSHRPDFTDGGQKRDFIYVKDVVDVLFYFLENKPANAIYNLGTGQARTFLDLATNTFHALGLEPNISFVDTPLDIRDTYQYFTEADMGKVRAAGYTAPFCTLEAGIQDYVQHYLREEIIW